MAGNLIGFQGQNVHLLVLAFLSPLADILDMEGIRNLLLCRRNSCILNLLTVQKQIILIPYWPVISKLGLSVILHSVWLHLVEPVGVKQQI